MTSLYTVPLWKANFRNTPSSLALTAVSAQQSVRAGIVAGQHWGVSRRLAHVLQLSSVTALLSRALHFFKSKGVDNGHRTESVRLGAPLSSMGCVVGMGTFSLMMVSA